MAKRKIKIDYTFIPEPEPETTWDTIEVPLDLEVDEWNEMEIISILKKELCVTFDEIEIHKVEVVYDPTWGEIDFEKRRELEKLGQQTLPFKLGLAARKTLQKEFDHAT